LLYVSGCSPQQVGIVETEKTAVAKQWLGKNVPATANTLPTVEDLLDVFFCAVGVVSYT
jgi:hypothetical protein